MDETALQATANLDWREHGTMPIYGNARQMLGLPSQVRQRTESETGNVAVLGHAALPSHLVLSRWPRLQLIARDFLTVHGRPAPAEASSATRNSQCSINRVSWGQCLHELSFVVHAHLGARCILSLILDPTLLQSLSLRSLCLRTCIREPTMDMRCTCRMRRQRCGGPGAEPPTQGLAPCGRRPSRRGRSCAGCRRRTRCCPVLLAGTAQHDAHVCDVSSDVYVKSPVLRALIFISSSQAQLAQTHLFVRPFE